MADAADTYVSFRVGINIFVVRDKQLLLGKRKKVFGDGTWELPGGHLENNERMLDAAARELLEETGLTAASFSFILLVNNRQRERHYIQTGFLAHDVVGEPTLKEPNRSEGWQWFPLDALPEPLFIGHQKLIEMFVEGETNFAES